MKRVLLVGSLLAASLVYSQDISIREGWQLLGATENIDTALFDSSGCVDYMWKYDESNPSSPWQVHISNGNSYNITVPTFDQIAEGEGFWVKGNSSCSINTITQINTKEVTVADAYVIKGYVHAGDVVATYSGDALNPGKWKFNFSGDLSDANITVDKGAIIYVDKDTNATTEFTMLAPTEATVVTPLTTHYLLNPEAYSAIKDDILTFDHIASVEKATTDPKVKALLKLTEVVKAVAVKGDLTKLDVAKAVANIAKGEDINKGDITVADDNTWLQDLIDAKVDLVDSVIEVIKEVKANNANIDLDEIYTNIVDGGLSATEAVTEVAENEGIGIEDIISNELSSVDIVSFVQSTEEILPDVTAPLTDRTYNSN